MLCLGRSHFPVQYAYGKSSSHLGGIIMPGAYPSAIGSLLQINRCRETSCFNTAQFLWKNLPGKPSCLGALSGPIWKGKGIADFLFGELLAKTSILCSAWCGTRRGSNSRIARFVKMLEKRAKTSCFEPSTASPLTPFSFFNFIFPCTVARQYALPWRYKVFMLRCHRTEGLVEQCMFLDFLFRARF